MRKLNGTRELNLSHLSFFLIFLVLEYQKLTSIQLFSQLFNQSDTFNDPVPATMPSSAANMGAN
jgi:hypothetical protein